MRLEARAQRDSRALLIPADSTAVKGELDIAEVVQQKVEYQQEKRVRNIRNVVQRAAEELGDEQVPDVDVDHDWAARVFSDVQDVSSEQMQVLWARVLAGQVRNSGNVSIRALSVLKNLDQHTAELFRTFGSMCVRREVPQQDGKTDILDARVPSLGGDPAQNCLEEYGLSYARLHTLAEYGLTSSSFRTRFIYQASVEWPREDQVVQLAFRFQDRWWVLEPTEEYDPSEDFWLSGTALTGVGRELLRAVDMVQQDRFRRQLVAFLAESHSLRMIEWPGPGPVRVIRT